MYRRFVIRIFLEDRHNPKNRKKSILTDQTGYTIYIHFQTTANDFEPTGIFNATDDTSRYCLS